MEVCEVSSNETRSLEENAALECLSAADKAKIEALLFRNIAPEEMRIVFEKLPESVTLVLLQTMQNLLNRRMNYTQTCVGWLRVLLQVHENIDDTQCKSALKQLLTSLQSAVTLQTPLNRLKGKLDLLLFQADDALADGQVEESQGTLDFDEISDEDTNNLLQTDNEVKVPVWDDFSEEEEEEDVDKSDEEMDQEKASENSDEEDASDLSNSECE